jgi:hypothetical protein
VSDSFFDKFVADLVKGAEVNSRAAGGPGVQIVVDRENHGREEKLANHAALGSLLGGLALPGLGAPIGAAIGADKGQGLSAAGGSILGGAGGALAGGGLGALIGALAGNPMVGMGVGGALGSVPGMMYGAHKGGEKETFADAARAKLSAAHEAGAKAAAARFGIKEAFLGALVGSVAGPALARAGMGRLAAGAGGKMLGGMAGKIMPRIAGGMGGAAFDQVAGAAGGALGQHMQQPQPGYGG